MVNPQRSTLKGDQYVLGPVSLSGLLALALKQELNTEERPLDSKNTWGFDLAIVCSNVRTMG